MKTTGEMLHWSLGAGSVLGLPILVDDTNAEFVYYQGELTHVDEVPLPMLHRETISTEGPKPKRVPVHYPTPQPPEGVEAFKAQARLAGPAPANAPRLTPPEPPTGVVSK